MASSLISAANKQRGGYAPCAGQWVSGGRGGWRLGDFWLQLGRSSAAWSRGSARKSPDVGCSVVGWRGESRRNALLRGASPLIANFQTPIGTPPSLVFAAAGTPGGLPPFGRACPRDGGRDRATGNLENRRPIAVEAAPSRPFRLASLIRPAKSERPQWKTGSGATSRAQSPIDPAKTGATGQKVTGPGDAAHLREMGGETATLGTGNSHVN